MRRVALVVLVFALALQSCAGTEGADTTPTADPETTTTMGSTTTLSAEERAEAFRDGKIAVATEIGRTGVSEWDGYWIFTVCFKSEEDFAAMDFQPITDQLMKAGFPAEFVTAGQPCDATLTVRLSGRALKANYSGSLDPQYTGAEVSGEIQLSAPGHQTIEQLVEGKIEPPSLISSPRFKSPRDAPFWEAVSSDICDFLRRVDLDPLYYDCDE